VLITAAITVCLLLAWPATQAVSLLFSDPDSTPSIVYPPVDGTLGEHLEQLQRSVQP
jgi:hypothetical protein